MAIEWQKYSLRELTINHDGKRKPVKESERNSGPYPYYGASGIVDHVDGYLFDGDYLLIAEDGENLRTRQTPIAFMAKGRFWVNNHAHIVTANDKSDTRFLMYALQLSEIDAYLTGAVMPKLTQANLNKIPISCPPIETQRAISRVLGSLDDKIDLNRRMNKTLEAMAQALFKDWFVDFGPVQAKLEGRQPSGLSPEAAALFPDALDADGKPQGWSYGTLGDLASLNPESWSKKNAPDEIEYVDLANTKWGAIESTTRFQWADAPSRAQRILRVGDTIVGTVRPGNGSYSYVSIDGLTGSTGFATLRPKDVKSRELVYLAATSSENIERLSHLADGGAYPAVRPDVVLASPVVLSDLRVVAAFSDVVAPFINAIEKNKQEAVTLASLRDLLLPKLLSGEIGIINAEQLVGAAI